MRKSETREAEQLVLGLVEPKRKRRKKPGRKPTGKCSDAPHRRRPVHRRSDPVHVVLRVKKDVPRLRKMTAFAAIRAALRKIGKRLGFRVVHASIQHNHLHFLVEAEDRELLSRGMQALAISIAKRLNRAWGRSGKVFAYRFHATPITNPRQARNALAYVLNNWRRHREDFGGERQRAAVLDPYASGLSFEGWAEHTRWEIPKGYEPLPVKPAKTWLLRVGWQRGARISVHEVPS
jgi:putative transposase